METKDFGKLEDMFDNLDANESINDWLYNNCSSIRAMLLKDMHENRDDPEAVKTINKQWGALRRIVLEKNGVELDVDGNIVGDVDGDQELIRPLGGEQFYW